MGTLAWAVSAGFWPLVTALGCASQDPNFHQPCSASERYGIYDEHAVERAGGTCGAQEDGMVRLTPELPSLDGCTFDAPDSISADQCTVRRAFSCPAVAPGSDGHARSVASVTTDTKENGSVFQETMTVTDYADDGSPSCKSTYDITFTRLAI